MLNAQNKQRLTLKSLTAGILSMLYLITTSVVLAQEAPLIINDAALIRGLDAKIGKLCTDEKAPPSKEFASQREDGNAHIITHPDSRFFTYTGGQVTRYYADRNKRACYWMGVTAEYYRGSSGGPVMDDAGNVISMVASANLIYYPSKNPIKDPKGNFQMVIRNCVPVDAIRKLITSPK